MVNCLLNQSSIRIQIVFLLELYYYFYLNFCIFSNRRISICTRSTFIITIIYKILLKIGINYSNFMFLITLEKKGQFVLLDKLKVI